MNQNRSLTRALTCLTHPVSIGALALLLLNDHLFRVYWPAWWTGKLGDFAWLFFAPFALSAILSWLVPAHLPSQERLTGWLAFGLVGGIFTLAKTLPLFHAWTVRLASLAFGFPVAWRMDPTDLVALSSLLASWWLWGKVALPDKSRTTPRPAWLLWCLAVFLTVANSTAPDEGITCLEYREGMIVAYSRAGTYATSPDHLDWQPVTFISECTWKNLQGQDRREIADPSNPAIMYRYSPDQSIQRSADGGQTWTVEFELLPISQVDMAYYSKTTPLQWSDFHASPTSVIFDPETGNLYFAMGQRGVLLREASGKYTWLNVGPYGMVNVSLWHVSATILTGEAILAILWGGMGVVILDLRRHFSRIHLLVLIIVALIWGSLLLFKPPALSTGPYDASFSSIAFLISGLLLLPLVLDAFFQAGISSTRLLLLLVLALVIESLLFLLPYVLWGLKLIPVYSQATLLGGLLGASCLLFYDRVLLRRIGTQTTPPDSKAHTLSDWAFLAGAGLVLVSIPLYVFFLHFTWFMITLIAAGALLMISGAVVRLWLAIKGRSK
jgi:hypothetical protein